MKNSAGGKNLLLLLNYVLIPIYSKRYAIFKLYNDYQKELAAECAENYHKESISSADFKEMMRKLSEEKEKFRKIVTRRQEKFGTRNNSAKFRVD